MEARLGTRLTDHEGNMNVGYDAYIEFSSLHCIIRHTALTDPIQTNFIELVDGKLAPKAFHWVYLEFRTADIRMEVWKIL